LYLSIVLGPQVLPVLDDLELELDMYKLPVVPVMSLCSSSVAQCSAEEVVSRKHAEAVLPAAIN
jgi:hypothetical protein